ncbi:calcium-translocating P-type ATPase, PMCA-type [Cloacibacillus porcorum]|uniref:calcium-translocating P-type ATPase, PMCA-type n=2 Tax=Cloacibacillus porcorum TaxID=1197717 RepID=UPI0023F1F8C5|nr:calcium-translocating P-type ATPase, PMCA-type [Cloacibacillus porcorum]MCC8185687.1 calcium-translocating P-type ATPase, PMCA-type [Cloacibacillus porcorum]
MELEMQQPEKSPTEREPFRESAAETLSRLGVDPRRGLTEAEAAESRRRYGENSFTKKKPASMLRRLAEAAREPMIIMLTAAALITLGVNIARGMSGGETDFIECAGIFAAISLSIIITVAMEGRSAKAFEALNRIADDTKVRVIREGGAELIPQREVAVGDILSVETGNRFPADARLIESTSLTADESALTGESMPVHKEAAAIFTDAGTPLAERANMLYSGCFAAGGSGLAVVTAVGDATEFGKIAGELSDSESAATPLQEKLAKMGRRIALLASGAAAAVFLLQLASFIARGTASLETVSEAFITSIVLIVAAVPEGLPTIVAVSLAINIIKMSKHNALVKKMAACETIGAINVICSDKTGTLTENRMTVTDIIAGGTQSKPQPLGAGSLLDNFCLNGTAEVHFEGERAAFIGNPTECALLVAAHGAGHDYRAIRGSSAVLHSFPFSSETKNMTTVAMRDGVITAYTKGSPEKILSMCSLSDGERREAEKHIAEFQERARRVIAFAHRDITASKDYATEREMIESGMTFDGFAAIADPLRADVFEAVERCRGAGIDVKILTGDNITTAAAIAGELGLLGDGHYAVEARELESLSDGELAERLPAIRVIARSTPSIKMRVVKTLKALGSVVAVTGDGINDAPAIKSADVGIAMGISGTEVSKEASDIVLLDDSFSTIVKAVQWGRGIYRNFQRFIQFQLTVNLSSVLVILLSVAAGFEAPFTAIQILWINIIMDGPPALTLGLEPVRGDLMNQPPVRRDASIVSREMLWNIVTNGLYITAVFMAQHWLNFLGGTKEQQPSILFTLFVILQLFNAFNSRALGSVSVLRGFGANRLMLGVFALTFALQVLITQYADGLFKTAPLSLAIWLKIVALGLSVILLSELVKLIRRGLGSKA